MKAKVSRKSGNVVYISSYKKRNVIKAYTKTDDDWYDILRANDTCSKVSFKAARLVGKLILELHKNNDRCVYKDNYWFSKIVNVSSAKQNLRIRKQISHIFNFPFRKIIVVDGALLKDVYEISFTENAYKILNFEDVKIDKEDGEVNASDTASNKSLHGDINVSTYGHKCPSYMYDKEKEEEAKAYSSSFSNNEKLKIKSFSEPEPALQETIIEILTLATGYPTEPAKVYQTEKIRSEATEVVTNCHGLEEQLYEKSVQLETQALASEKEHYQFHKNRKSSSGISLLQDIPLLTNLLAEPNSETTKIHEEVTPMKAQQIPLEPERNMEFELSGAIFKSFGNVRSGEIMENCKFISINRSKLGVQVSNGFNLSANDKDTLKACIRQVYGDNISIVSSVVVKIAQPETKFLQEPQNDRKIQKWEQFKKELLRFFPEKTGNHILNAWFDKLRVSEDAPNNRIILTGSTFYVDSIYNRFQSAIESVVKKQKVTLELHYENNSQRPIIYKPNGGF